VVSFWCPSHSTGEGGRGGGGYGTASPEGVAARACRRRAQEVEQGADVRAAEARTRE
jgi:hypothetical protein